MSSPERVVVVENRAVGGLSELREVPYSRLFPWLRLFRAVGLAADARCLMLAALGLVLLHLGGWGLEHLFPNSVPIAPPVLRPPGPAFPEDRNSIVADVQSAPWRLTEPVRVLVGPFVTLLQPDNTWSTVGRALLLAVWGVLVWGPIGGAIARIALARTIRSEAVSLVAALRYAFRRWVALIAAPLSPLLAIVFFTAGCALFGLLYRIPGAIGPTIAGALAFLPLIAGLLMTIVLVGLALGWPLMPAIVAAQGEDGFDALSRSYAYVNQRRWRYGSLIGLAWLIGTAGLIFVDFFARLVVQLTRWALSFSAPPEKLAALFGNGGTTVDPTAATLHTAWLSFIGLLAHGWIYSFFWTAAALIYLVLRHSVDGTPFHVLYQEQEKPPLPPGIAPTAPTDSAPVAEPSETPTP